MPLVAWGLGEEEESTGQGLGPENNGECSVAYVHGSMGRETVKAADSSKDLEAFHF
jgi:hypothetical protein